MQNNAQLGMTLQKCVCDIYNIEPSEYAAQQFQANYNKTYESALRKLVPIIFQEIGQEPIECLTLRDSGKYGETHIPHNFRLSNGATLSFRSNLSGDKVAPRVVGQAGINTFNDHFGDIAGKTITNKEEIKEVIYDNIHLMLPIFIDYLFSSDYTVWVQSTDAGFKYTLFNNASIVDIDLERNNFSFTRDLTKWVESTTLKYKGKSIAEVQIHKNRTFKFRFIMGAISDLLIEQTATNETLGITAEAAICHMFGLKVPNEYRKRISTKIEKELVSVLNTAFTHLPPAIKSTGAEKGARGQESKCPYDFILKGNKTLSLKTNTGKMVCPPEVGQPGAATCYHYFKAFIEGNCVTNDSFKTMVLEHISDIMPIYINHLFDSDYLLWIFKQGDQYKHKVFNSGFANEMVWDANGFEFTKPSIEVWNESNTVKYHGVSIGEFQVHRNRSCFKFRVNLENFDVLIHKEQINGGRTND